MNKPCGGVAQLGERSVRIREVKGSNPSVSTKSKIRTFVRMDRGSDFFIFRKIRHFEGRSSGDF